jgi:MoaA/NifB/PqqE/SkfB family radical SAM enzyme
MSEVNTHKALAMHPAIKVWRNKSLKSFINILKATRERRERKSDVSSLPFVMFYEPTSFCNLKCPSCPTGTGMLDRPKERVDPEQFKATVDALADKVFVMYMYNWGEPLLHKEFSKLVKYATSKGIVVKTSSNLSIPLNDAQLKDIVESGLQQLKVGIDGATPEVHEQYRRRSDLALVHKNVRTIADFKKDLNSPTPEISVAYHVFAHNESEIEEFKKQMPALGVNHFGPSPSWLPPDGTVSKPKDPRYDMYKIANKAISGLRSQGDELKPCGWLYYATVINPGGTISPCCGVASESYDYGELPAEGGAGEMDSGFRSIWKGKKYAASRKLFAKKERLEKWSAKNLRDLHPDGMAFSQLSTKSSLICNDCPIPHTLERWTGELEDIYKLYRQETKRCLRSLNLPGAMVNTIKTIILRSALRSQ